MELPDRRASDAIQVPVVSTQGAVTEDADPEETPSSSDRASD